MEDLGDNMSWGLSVGKQVSNSSYYINILSSFLVMLPHNEE